MTRARLLLATATLSTLALTACSDDGTATDAGDDPTTSSTASASATPDGESTAPPADPSGSASSGGTADTVAVPLYFVGDTPQGPRLFREFQQVDGADPLLEAATQVFGGAATDPDYRTLLPLATPTSVTASPESIDVTLEPGSFSAGEPTRREARLALQQLVYTLQGVAQSEAPVFVRFPDGTPFTLYGFDTTGGLTRAKELNVLALVNVTTPEQGATVSGSFTAEGLASSFEGTVPWQVVAADGSVVADGSAQADGYLDGLYPWTTDVDLSGVAPGDYTFVARTDDPSEGEGGGPTEDTKDITVE